MASSSYAARALTRLQQFASFFGFRSMPPSKKGIHFGGGNIGRGFVAEFLHKSGYEVVFVDVAEDLIAQLQNAKSYTVTELCGSESAETYEINNFRAINSKHDPDKVVDEIATADIVTCAVGVKILRFLSEAMAKGIQKRDPSRAPLVVVACENAINATDTWRDFIEEYTRTKIATPDAMEKFKANARFANSAIDRIVPEQDPNAGLNVKIEKYFEWCVEGPPLGDHRPQIKGIHYVDQLEPYIERKLYTVNTSHATAAYYGYQKGLKYVHEAVADPEIGKIIRETLKETAKLIVEKHGIDEHEQAQYVDSILKRISDEFYQDKVERVGRAPVRKLGRTERFIGPAQQLSAKGYGHSYLLGGIEQVLRFQDVTGDEESEELAALLRDNDAETVTAKLTGLSKDNKQENSLFVEVAEIVKRVQGEAQAC